jgi:hypothetical protein
MVTKTLVRSQREVAEALGVTRKTICEWLGEGAPGKDRGGYYDVERIHEWRREKTKRGGTRDDNGTGVISTAERLKRAQADEREHKAKLAALELKIRLGQYVALDEIEKRDVERIKVVKTGLLSLPRRLAQEMEGLNANQREVMLKTRFRELLERFSRM